MDIPLMIKSTAGITKNIKNTGTDVDRDIET